MPAERVEPGRHSGVAARERGYAKSGNYTRASALPDMLRRIADPSVTADTLTPLERESRDWHDAVLADLGGPDHVSATRRTLLEVAVGTRMLLLALDAYLFGLARVNGLVNRRSRRTYAVLDTRMRQADSLVGQLRALGLDRVRVLRHVEGLEGYLADRHGRKRRPERPASSSSSRRDDAGRFRQVPPVEPEAEALELEPLDHAPGAEQALAGARVRAQAAPGRDMSSRTAQDMAVVELEALRAAGPSAPAHPLEREVEAELEDTAGARGSSTTASAPATTTSSTPSSAEPTP